jgi:predicted HAD superfamily Cof-like phosphohydrolase
MTDKFYGQGYVEDQPKSSDPHRTNYEKVVQFMKIFGQQVYDFPTIPDETIQKLRVDLIDEEFNEFKEALAAKDIVAVADALTDILYVVYGAGAAFGIDLDATFAEVHDSNMSKLGEDGQPIFREDGKVLKGPNYFKPDLFSVLFKNNEPVEPDLVDILSLEAAEEEGLYDLVVRDSIGVVHTFKAAYDEENGSLTVL